MKLPTNTRRCAMPKTENELMWEANGFFLLPPEWATEPTSTEGVAFGCPDSDTCNDEVNDR